LEQKALLKKKPIDKHLTTKNGCDVHIVGNVTFCCPMSFSGTITVGPPCQPVQYVFIVIVPTGVGDIEYGGGTSTQADFTVLFGDDPHLRQDFADYIIQEAE